MGDYCLWVFSLMMFLTRTASPDVQQSQVLTEQASQKTPFFIVTTVKTSLLLALTFPSASKNLITAIIPATFD
jgi:hypothetical protein